METTFFQFQHQKAPDLHPTLDMEHRLRIPGCEIAIGHSDFSHPKRGHTDDRWQTARTVLPPPSRSFLRSLPRSVGTPLDPEIFSGRSYGHTRLARKILWGCHSRLKDYHYQQGPITGLCQLCDGSKRAHGRPAACHARYGK